jgi:hypothetical protein
VHLISIQPAAPSGPSSDGHGHAWDVIKFAAFLGRWSVRRKVIDYRNRVVLRFEGEATRKTNRFEKCGELHAGNKGFQATRSYSLRAEADHVSVLFPMEGVLSGSMFASGRSCPIFAARMMLQRISTANWKPSMSFVDREKVYGSRA